MLWLSKHALAFTSAMLNADVRFQDWININIRFIYVENKDKFLQNLNKPMLRGLFCKFTPSGDVLLSHHVLKGLKEFFEKIASKVKII